MPQPNPVLLNELRELLALAESGKITSAILVGIGPDAAHHGFAAPKPDDLGQLIFETGICVQGLQANIIMQRMEQQQDQRQGIVRKPIFQA